MILVARQRRVSSGLSKTVSEGSIWGLVDFLWDHVTDLPLPPLCLLYNEEGVLLSLPA
jgi:hypothetical protein